MDTLTTSTQKEYIAFANTSKLVLGSHFVVGQAIEKARRQNPNVNILAFDLQTAELTDFDARNPSVEPSAGPGRPKLGVVPREITLLPRHWDWLKSQPGGASVALRKLVEVAMKANVDHDKVRLSTEITYRFMSAIAGHLPGFEEASRALFAANGGAFESVIADWPKDIRSHLLTLAANAFSQSIANV
jgi:uncharacterized protein